ncbi:fused MFS/spermidine synthase [Knoellia sp. DB2414S]|uniref:Fused MFS/spermidine synthase n=2 Tax=Knoellia koreensis TaxID=2730921 RepID=A0A849HLB8_9MICO|nr:fused MFS/spermidine synthase [Knoellia sp. DB2414S]NNM47889.1 fused MFS/spermidine synthase [Knoellia sp. DB2414S]
MEGFELEQDEHGGSVVKIGGYPQSYVSLDDPELLVFGYVQLLAAVLDCLPAGRLAVTHVGGAAMTLPRYVQHVRPGSPQIVFEPDAALTDQVRRALPLPRGHRIRVRPQAGREGVGALRADSADAMVVDAFAGNQVPADLTSVEWFAEVARVLRPGGVHAMNTADDVGHRHAARLHAAMREHLPHTAVIAQTDIWKRRRFGNLVLVGSTAPLPLQALSRAVAATVFPSTVVGGEGAARALGGAKPFTDADATASPPPPTPPDGWRLR